MQTYKTREDFLNSRIGKIGASDAPVIMNVSPFSTPYQLWQNKLGLVKDKGMTQAMQRGVELESIARMAFNEEMSVNTDAIQFTHKEYPWLIASLDGYDHSNKVAVEIKCPGEKDHSLAKDGKIPEKYIPQLQHQLYCCELDFIYYYSFDGCKGVILKEYRDNSYIKKLFKKELEFYKNLQELTPPELTERDYKVKVDNDWCMEALNYLQYEKQMKELEEKMKNSKSKLIEYSEGQNCKGAGISICNIVKKGNIDYNSIPELKNVDLESYRKPSTSYVRILKESA